MKHTTSSKPSSQKSTFLWKSIHMLQQAFLSQHCSRLLKPVQTFSTLRFPQWQWEHLTAPRKLSLKCSKARNTIQDSTSRHSLKSPHISAKYARTMLLSNQSSSEQIHAFSFLRFRAECFQTSKNR